jgi:hypothetical protein
MARPRTTFEKLQKERARQEKQAAKRARRQGTADPGAPVGYAQPAQLTHYGTDSAPAEPGLAEPGLAEPDTAESG